MRCPVCCSIIHPIGDQHLTLSSIFYVVILRPWSKKKNVYTNNKKNKKKTAEYNNVTHKVYRVSDVHRRVHVRAE